MSPFQLCSGIHESGSPHLTARRTLRGVVQNGSILYEEGWAKGATDKRKGRITFRPGQSFGGKGMARVFIMQIASSFLRGEGVVVKTHVTDYLNWCWTRISRPVG